MSQRAIKNRNPIESKPKIDPVDEYLAQFDEPKQKIDSVDAYLAEQGIKEQPGIVDDIVQGLSEVGSQALLGYEAPVAAAILHVSGNAPDGETFDQTRDRVAEAQARARAESPMASKIGQMAGMGAMMLAPAGPVSKAIQGATELIPALKAPSFLTGAAKGAIGGSIAGAIQNPGEVQGPEGAQVGDRAVNALIGGLIGAPVGGLVGAGQKTVKDVQESASWKPTNEFGDELSTFQNKALETPEEYATKVAQAGEKLNVKPSTGMLNQDRIVKGQEAILAESPSLVGTFKRNQLIKIQNQLNERAKKIAGDVPDADADLLGLDLKNAIMRTIRERNAPIAKLYNAIEGQLQSVPVADKEAQNWAKILNQKYLETQLNQSSPSAPSIRAAINDVLNANNFGQVAKAVSQLQQIGRQTKDGVLAEAANDLKNLYQNSLETYARKIAETSPDKALRVPFGQNIDVEMSSAIKMADEQYRPFMQMLTKFARSSGLAGRKERVTVGQVLDRLDQTKSKDVIDKLWASGDGRTLAEMSMQLPDVFDKLRKAKITEILNKAIISGDQAEPLAQRFIKQVDAMPSTAQKLLFGNMESFIPELATLTRSMPSMALVNPSRTSTGSDLVSNALGSLNPVTNVRDLLRLGVMQQPAQALGTSWRPSGVDVINRASSIPISLGASAAAASRPSIEIPEKKIMGWNESYLVPLLPNQIPAYLDNINRDPSISKVEKARINMLVNQKGLRPLDRSGGF